MPDTPDAVTPGRATRSASGSASSTHRGSNRRPTAWRRLAFWTNALVVTTALLGCARDVKVAYPVVPSTLQLRSTTTTTIGPDRSKMALPSIDVSRTSTATIGFVVGAATLTGVVSGPDGPVPGAKVRVERLVGSQRAEITVDADAEGRYTLENVQLGRVRVRAWRPPDLAMMSDDVFFASATTKHNLALDLFGRTDVQWAMAPDTPLRGRKVNIVIQVSTRMVDELGRISVVPLSGVGVSIYPTGVLLPMAAGERLTNEAGRVVFTLLCDSDGSAGLDVRLATGGQAVITPPPCTTPAVTSPPDTIPVVDPNAPTSFPPIDAVTTLPPVETISPSDPVISLVPVPIVPQ